MLRVRRLSLAKTFGDWRQHFHLMTYSRITVVSLNGRQLRTACLVRPYLPVYLVCFRLEHLALHVVYHTPFTGACFPLKDIPPGSFAHEVPRRSQLSIAQTASTITYA